MANKDFVLEAGKLKLAELESKISSLVVEHPELTLGEYLDALIMATKHMTQGTSLTPSLQGEGVPIIQADGMIRTNQTCLPRQRSINTPEQTTEEAKTEREDWELQRSRSGPL